MPTPAARRWTIEVVAATAAYFLVELRLAGGLIVPPHVARREDLVLQVVDGEIELIIDGGRERLLSGDGAPVPRGRPRRLSVLRPARLLVAGTPGGIESLAPIFSDPSVEPDDLAALLAAAGVDRVPARW